MNSEQITDGLLINEWQLGSQLNIAVANGTRDKFNLLLSLLSSDARDFPQFDLPKATEDSLTSLELRETFALSEPQPLVNSGISLKQAEQLSIAIHNKNITDVRFQCILNNEAVLSRYRNDAFDVDVVDNLSFLAQERLKNAQENTLDNESNTSGVDYALVKKYQTFDFEDKPVKLNYM